ncbi:MAG: hypothetical protein ABH828_00065 [archaeon]
MIFKIFGIVGLLLITLGIIVRKREQEDLFYMTGGVFLLIYSLYIGDLIFIVLQIIFTFAAIYDYVRLKRK